MESLGPKVYQDNALKAFDAKFGIRGKQILEIGGSNLPQEHIFGVYGPAQWVCVDPIAEDVLTRMRSGEREPYLDHLRGSTLLRFSECDATFSEKFAIICEPVELGTNVFREKFDLAFSVAAFEHVHALPKALEVIFGALVPGGALWSQYSPIWSSEGGHHCDWIHDGRTEEAKLSGQGLIPAFGHLLYTPEELAELLRPYYPEAFLKWSIFSIYEKDYLNRYFFDDYVRMFKASPFERVDVKGVWPRPPSPEVLSELLRLHPDHSGFEFAGVEVAAFR